MKSVAATLALSLCIAGADAADRPWRLLENPHFRVLTNADESRARALVEEMDRFRIVLQQVSDAKKPADAPPALVLILATADEFRAYAPRRGVGGYLLRNAEGLPETTIVLPARGTGLDAMQTIRHEYVHSLNQYRPVRFPGWYEEGIAEVFSLIEVDGRKVSVGLLPRDRFDYVDKLQSAGIDAWASFDKLVADNVSPHTTHFAGAYAQYWLMTHYLVYGRPDLRDELERCLILSDGMMKPLDAFRTAFGMTPDEMWSRDLRNYVRKVPAQVYTFRNPIEPTPFSSGPADTAEVERTLTTLRAQVLPRR